jgi:hypothetical protein
VINEPYSNHELQDILGNSAMINWFRQAKQSDRGHGCYQRLRHSLSRGAVTLTSNYFNTIQYLLAAARVRESACRATLARV